MMKILRDLFKKPVVAPEPVTVKPERPRQVYTTDDFVLNQNERLEELWQHNFKNAIHPTIGMDSKLTMDESPSFAMDNINIKASFAGNTIVPTAQVLWYASQTFIGYQMCALMAQQWLISKACLMPAKDATRNGYEITINDGSEIDPEILDAIRNYDVTYKLNKNLIEFVQMGRVFGIRVVMFIIDVPDQDDFYKNPFNEDGIPPGSYRGISQIDPYWITPQLGDEAAGNPSAIDFYEPTWWIINGKPVHRTHLIIFRTEEVSDILKPTYIFGGIPIPQKIAERVFAAERTANEAPQLALTKRTDVIKVDLAQAALFPAKFKERIDEWVRLRDNYGIKTLDLEDEMVQFDTSLTDLDAVIMTQYQLVAAAANVPVTKLLGTTPKGFNATGAFDESSYHEELESLQTHDLTPLITRHHLLLMRSEISPKFGIEPFDITVKWNELDAMTAKEQAEINRFKAETGRLLTEIGAIDGHDERNRIINDPHSGYMSMVDDIEEPLEEEPSNPIGA